MDEKQRFDQRANEANLKLNEKLNPDNSNPYKESTNDSITETNMKLDAAFYGDNEKEEVVPTYVTNETAAITISGDD